MHINIESLERATLDAVAPSAVGQIPGWLLPFDSSTVGRAISAVPLHHEGADPAVIRQIEALYAERGLATQFRIADVAGMAGLQQGLLQAGYTPQQPTLTLVGSVGLWPGEALRTVQISQTATEGWKSVYLSADFDPVDAANRVRALSRSQCVVYAWMEEAGHGVAAGTAAFSQGWASLHGLRTLARARGRGCATALIAALGQIARSKGIDACFLQVEEGNASAVRLYHSLGFETAWRYHYWRKAK